MTQLQISNIYKSFKNKKILENINMKIDFGKIHGLIGKNGVGKSTLMKIITGLEKQDLGLVSYVNNDKENIKTTGLIESPALYPFLSAVENIKKYNSLFDNNIKDEEILFFLELVGLKSSYKKKVKNYSLGMKQRLGLAQVFSIKPDFLVLDEPFNGLDPEITIRIKKYLVFLRKEGKGILISSHQLNDLDQLCDYISLLNKGNLYLNINKDNYNKINKYKIETSSLKKTDAILRQHKIQVTYSNDEYILFLASKNEINDILKKIIDFNIYVYSVTPFKKTLEEKFLEYN